jgi:hypothetical protein
MDDMHVAPWDHALAINVVRKRLAHRPSALGRTRPLCFPRRFLGDQLIFGCRRFQLFEFKLHLLQPLTGDTRKKPGARHRSDDGFGLRMVMDLIP